MAVLATKQKYVKDIFIEPWDVDLGIYSMMFSIGGLWKYVIVDDYVPALDTGSAEQNDPAPGSRSSAARAVALLTACVAHVQCLDGLVIATSST